MTTLGLNINATKLLLRLHADNFKFGKVLTLGRQRLNIPKRNLQKNLNDFGHRVDARELKAINQSYCEPFPELLGATQVGSIVKKVADGFL